MITTLSAMRMSHMKSTIIGWPLLLSLLLALPWLGGCGAVRLAYNNAPQLTWWWVDDYFDFSREQAPEVKRNLDSFFDWHRSTQLTGYATLLASAQTEVMQATTPAQVCRWQDQFRDKIEPSLDRLLTQAADLVPGLAEPQFKHLEKRYAKIIDEMRKDFLQADPASRLTASLKRANDRAELLYGRLDAPQKAIIKDGVLASPFNPELWLAERQRRQRDTVQTLRRLVAERADTDKRLAALRTLAARVERSPDPDYRAYQIKLVDYNCNLAAQVHNTTTAAQRKKARESLKDWEEDMKVLIANPQPGG
jgi:uncharacterized protein YfcZ (UPF0381/DUF406 family)